MNWLIDIVSSIDLRQVLIFVGLFVASLVFSVVVLGIVMVKIPANYFSSHYVQDFLPESSWFVRWGAVLAKNLVGIFLIILGILLSLPGVPGQGVLTILLGLIMVDIPGKRPIEARIIKRPNILTKVNSLRNKYGKPPLILD